MMTLLAAGLAFAVTRLEPTDEARRDAFAFRLKDELLNEHTRGNICFSPLSVDFALAALLNGTGPKSIGLMRAGLQLGSMSLGQLNEGNRRLSESLELESLKIANAIWLRGNIKPETSFTQRMREDYKAYFFAVPNFGNGSVSAINDW